MPALPALPDPFGNFYLPLSEGTARHLALNMLAGEHASEFTSSNLLRDPALVCWCLAHVPPHRVPRLSQLVWWANKHDWIRAFNADVNPLSPAESVYRLKACCKLAEQSLRRARMAAVRAPEGLDSPQVVIALVKNVAKWFALLNPQESEYRIPACFPSSLLAGNPVKVAANAADREAGSKSRTRSSGTHAKSDQSIDADRAEIAETWSKPSDWCRLAVQLAKTLARADRLQSRFDQTLDEEKLRAMSELAYGASHEINNPLANISTRAQMLMRDEPDPQRKRSLAAITHQAFRAHEMINDMMLFAKPPKVWLRSAALGDILRQCRSELLENSGQTNVNWEIDSSCDKFDVWVDASTLVVALKAIFQNSIEAFEDEGTIMIHAASEAQGQTVSVRIADSGPGVPDAIRRRIFDPFYSGREAGRGLGFGLPKAWRIIQQQGGELTLERSRQNHTEFVARLKAAHPFMSS